MTEKIITTVEDFEDIQLNVDDLSVKADTKPEEITDLDSLETETEPKVPEVKPEEPKVPEVKPEEIGSLDDINFDDLDTPTIPSVDNLKKDIADKKPIDNIIGDLEIDTGTVSDTISSVVDNAKDAIPTPIEPPKKRGRPAKKVEVSAITPEVKATPEVVVVNQGKIDVVEEKLVSEPIKSKSSFLNPVFELNKVKTDKYQQRQTQRTVDQIQDLVEKIKLQGQLVPVQIVKENEDYQMMDGFGRYNALVSLGINTISAIIHEGLSPDEISKISSGANLGRAELSEWDKIWSMGKFWEDNIEKHDKDDLCKIFGVSKSTLYSNLEYFELFKRDVFLVDLFKTNSTSYFIFSLIAKYLKKYPLVKLEDLHKFIKSKIENPNTTREKFDAACLLTFEMITKQNTIVTEDQNPNIDIDDSDISKFTEGTFKKDTKLLPENMDMTVKIVVESYMDNILKCIKRIKENIAGINAITNHGDFVDSAIINKSAQTMEDIKVNILKLI